MKRFPSSLLAAAALGTALGFAASAGADDDSRADGKSLAHGYAAAFQSMDKSTVSILYWSAGQVETIKDVNQITAHSGTLLIKAYGGGRQILDAGRVIKITAN